MVSLQETSTEREYAAESRQTARDQLWTARRLNRITLGGICVSVLSLLAVAYGFRLTKISLDLTRQAAEAATSQAETTRKEFQSSQRPWVSLDFTEAKLWMQNDSALIEVRFRAENVGHSVAQGVYVRPILVVNSKDDGTECNEAAKFAIEPHAYPAGLIIFPGHSLNGNFPAFTRKEEIMDALGARKDGVSLRIVGCVTYSSNVDEDPHYTRVVYWVSKKGTDYGLFPVNSGAFDVDLRPDVNGFVAK